MIDMADSLAFLTGLAHQSMHALPHVTPVNVCLISLRRAQPEMPFLFMIHMHINPVEVVKPACTTKYTLTWACISFVCLRQGSTHVGVTGILQHTLMNLGGCVVHGSKCNTDKHQAMHSRNKGMLQRCRLAPGNANCVFALMSCTTISVHNRHSELAQISVRQCDCKACCGQQEKDYNVRHGFETSALSQQ